MKSFKLLLFFLFAFSGISSAQMVVPSHWSHTVKDLGKGEFDIVITVTLDAGWHVFSKDYFGISVATSLTLEKNKDFVEVGKLREAGNLIVKEVDLGGEKETEKYYENKAVFSQKIKLLKKDALVKGGLDYMTCKEVCLPPTTYDFELKLHSDAVVEKVEAPVVDSSKTKIDTSKVDTAINKTSTEKSDSSLVETYESKNDAASDSIWKIFLLGFGSGLLALIQPCVFPIIPLTVSFFTKRSKDKAKGRINAMVYAASILIIFVVFGFLVSLIFGSDALNSLSSSWLFNLVFFVLLFVFSLSFLGVFEITLPSSWINKTESFADRGGFVGIFFMAFSLVLISFSCTVPIIGNLLPLITKGDTIRPLVGLGAFGLALAIPFGFFAWFPGFLQSLPKSGGWMNTVKVTLGFVELALCLIYLSKVDLAYHWQILSRDIFLVLWITIFGVLGLYLIGKIRLSHDGDIQHISVGRLLMAILSFAVTLYLLPGIFGAPLKPISGYLPPQATQDFDLSRLLIEGVSNSPSHSSKPKKYGDIFHMPHGIDGYFDYENGMQAAKELGKPVMLDFTGWACVNCRKMEAAVWSDANVLKRLKEDYVLISMFVDDKTMLPEDKQFISSYSGNKIKTLGNWYSDIQASKYNTNTQPFYVLMDNNGKLLNDTRSFNEDIDAYVKWLDKGLEEYKKR
ncbi:MAG: disulfide bond formation protein DsbD [Sphingobacteriales bacterium]|nr:MAG: disulfide bond formation protein DsbD [Sphingobacteriales bacterium]